jgi:hypothetical protein
MSIAVGHRRAGDDRLSDVQATDQVSVLQRSVANANLPWVCGEKVLVGDLDVVLREQPVHKASVDLTSNLGADRAYRRTLGRKD